MFRGETDITAGTGTASVYRNPKKRLYALSIALSHQNPYRDVWSVKRGLRALWAKVEGVLKTVAGVDPASFPYLAGGTALLPLS